MDWFKRLRAEKSVVADKSDNRRERSRLHKLELDIVVVAPVMTEVVTSCDRTGMGYSATI